ncbi:MAG: UDP-3-O-[3-hydroxymyristoyl] glucosamine N-acyltransferase protein [Planctomycetota bacterium]
MSDFDLSLRTGTSDALAASLGLSHSGPVRRITTATTPSLASEGSLVFLAGSGGSLPEVPCTVLAGAVWAKDAVDRGFAVIESAEPRLDFARALACLRPPVPAEISPLAVIDPQARVASGVRIEPFVVVGADAVIEEGCHLRAHSVVRAGVVVARDCEIGEHAVLGNDGLTVPVGRDGVPVPMRHLGGLRIGERTRVGPGATIGRGTLDTATVGTDCVIGPQVNIGHNARVGSCCILTGGCRLGGGVECGDRAWVGTGAVIHQKVRIGEGAVIGGGAVVTRDVEPGATVAAFPAQPLRRIAALLRRI